MERQADAIVIGAGVIGCSIAFHLAKAGAGKVLLLDKNGVAAGNSAKSGALIRMHYTDEPQVKLALAGLQYFQHWSDMVGGPGGEAGFTETGFIYLVGQNNAERLRQNVAMQRRLGVDTRELSLEDVREIQLGMAIENVAAVCYEPHSGYADPVATTQALARAAQRHGVEIESGILVEKLVVKGGRVVGLETNQGLFEAPLIVAAIGPWSGRLLGPVGIELPIKPHRAQLAFFDRPAALDNKLTYVDLANWLYGRRTNDGAVLAGSSGFAFPDSAQNEATTPAITDQWGGQSDPDEGLDPDNYKETTDPEYIEYTRKLLENRFPALHNSTFRRGHAGIYDMTPDTRPILGATPLQGLYIAAGFSGQGFKIAPAVGLALSQLIIDGKTRPDLDLQPFRLSRFAENQPLHGEWEYI